MKIVLALVVFGVTLFAHSSATYNNGDGKPDCTGSNASKIFRNNWDPTRYWQCSADGAVSVECPAETGFLDADKKCVSWPEWKWTAPFDPPTELSRSLRVYDNGNGKPVCTSETIGTYRNNWDPTLYWVCVSAGAEAESMQCPDEMAYYVVENKCVSWADWKWTEFSNPPSA